MTTGQGGKTEHPNGAGAEWEHLGNQEYCATEKKWGSCQKAEESSYSMGTGQRVFTASCLHLHILWLGLGTFDVATVKEKGDVSVSIFYAQQAEGE